MEPSGDEDQATRKAKRQRKQALVADASGVYDGAGEADIRERAERFRDTWKGREPEAAANFFVGFDQTLSYLAIDFPTSLASLMRTTNLLERFHKEMRRKQWEIGSCRASKAARCSGIGSRDERQQNSERCFRGGCENSRKRSYTT